MKRQWLNPLTVCILILIALVAIPWLWLGGGKKLDLLSLLIFAPFLLDITRGVGAAEAHAFRWIVFVSESIVVAMVVFRHFAQPSRIRTILTGVGVLAAIVHFMIVILGYVSTGLH